MCCVYSTVFITVVHTPYLYYVPAPQHHRIYITYVYTNTILITPYLYCILYQHTVMYTPYLYYQHRTYNSNVYTLSIYYVHIRWCTNTIPITVMHVPYHTCTYIHIHTYINAILIKVMYTLLYVSTSAILTVMHTCINISRHMSLWSTVCGMLSLAIISLNLFQQSSQEIIEL